MINLPTWNQGDPRWRDIELAPGLPMWRYGCLITSIAMGLKNYAIDIDPGQLCLKLKAAGGFDSEGNMVHSVMNSLFHDVLLYRRVHTTNFPGDASKTLIGEAIRQVDQLLKLGQPVPLVVDHVGNDGLPDHAVIAKEYRNGDFLINNPDGGIEQWFSDRYGDPMKKLYGHFAIIGPGLGFPPQSTPDHQKMGLALWKAAMVWRGRDVATYSKEIVDSLV